MAALAACGSGIDVRTVAAPEAAMLGGRQTFRVVEATSDNNTANFVGDANGYGIPDPMVENSITSKLMHDEIRAAFEALGYRYSPGNADFEVAFRATVAPIMDIRTYGYGGYGGYGYRRYGYDGYAYGYDAWGCCGDMVHSVGSYDRRTVIIDAIDPNGKLLWRGQGVADWYSEPKRFLKDLRHAVKAVAERFPRHNGALAMTAVRY